MICKLDFPSSPLVNIFGEFSFSKTNGPTKKANGIDFTLGAVSWGQEFSQDGQCAPLPYCRGQASDQIFKKGGGGGG